MIVVAFIIFGGLVGWVASLIMRTNRQMGIIANVLAGVAGAIIGNWIMHLFNKTGFSGFSFRSFLVALLGSVVLIAILKIIIKK